MMAEREWMGKALAEGDAATRSAHDRVCGRSAKEAQSNLEDSLRRLKTDRIDLWQFHEIVYDNDPDWIFAPDGAFQTGLKAVREGKVRYLGFTGHKDPIIHLKMLSMPFEWATVQMPLNVMDVHYRSFQRLVLPVLLQRNIGALAMKSLGGTGVIVSGAGIPVEDALRYVLSLPISTLVTGIDSEKVLDQNLKIVREFQPLTVPERAAIDARTLAMGGDGRFELFKSSKMFDGPVHRKQHGFSTQVGPVEVQKRSGREKRADPFARRLARRDAPVPGLPRLGDGLRCDRLLVTVRFADLGCVLRSDRSPHPPRPAVDQASDPDLDLAPAARRPARAGNRLPPSADPARPRPPRPRRSSTRIPTCPRSSADSGGRPPSGLADAPVVLRPGRRLRTRRPG
jgi:hypothetical protein